MRDVSTRSRWPRVAHHGCLAARRLQESAFAFPNSSKPTATAGDTLRPVGVNCGQSVHGARAGVSKLTLTDETAPPSHGSCAEPATARPKTRLPGHRSFCWPCAVGTSHRGHQLPAVVSTAHAIRIGIHL